MKYLFIGLDKFISSLLTILLNLGLILACLIQAILYFIWHLDLDYSKLYICIYSDEITEDLINAIEFKLSITNILKNLP